MAYNLGYVDAGYNLSYVDTVSLDYVLRGSSHGTANSNSIMGRANFNTTGRVELGVVSDFDPLYVIVDWQGISDNQHWLTDVNTLTEFDVTATADVVDEAVLKWKTPDGSTGEFIVTADITETGASLTVTPQGTVTVESVTVGETTADITFTYNNTDQTGFEYTVDGGGTWTAFTSSPANITGLNDSTQYTATIRPVNEYGTGNSASTTFTTDNATGAVPQGTISIGVTTTTATSISAPFTYSDTDDTGFQKRLNSGLWSSTTSPAEFSGLTENTQYTVSIRAVNAQGTGTVESVILQTDDVVSPPAGTITFDTLAVTESTIFQTFYYSDSDQTGFEYRVDGGAWVATPEPEISLTGLNGSTQYLLEARAVNNDGVGSTASTNVTTDSVPVPQGTITIGTPTVGAILAVIPFTYSDNDETGYEWKLDTGAWQSISTKYATAKNLTANTSYLITVRAVNGAGVGTTDTVTIQTAAVGGPALGVSGMKKSLKGSLRGVL